MRNFIFCMIVMVASASCSKEIQYELDFEGERIVVNSFFSGNDGFFGTVTKTVSPSGSILYDSLFLEDALFIVFEDGSPFDTLQSLGGGLYEGGKYPSLWNQYHISVSKTDFKTVSSAPQSLPSDFDVDILHVKRNQVVPLNTGFPTLDFDLMITDDGSEKNYYFVEAKLIINGEASDNFNFWLPNKSDFSTEPCQTDEFFFPDDCFNGQDFFLSLALETKSLDQEVAQEAEIIIKSISKDYYEYLKSNKPQPEGFEIPFTEPNFLFSNMVNGYGIFGGFTEKKILVQW